MLPSCCLLMHLNQSDDASKREKNEASDQS